MKTEDSSLPFDCYLQEQIRGRNQSELSVIIKRISEYPTTICLKKHEAATLFEKLKELITIMNSGTGEGTDPRTEPRNEHKPYSGKWLEAERSKLIRKEKYEYIHDLDFLINIVKEHEHQHGVLREDGKIVYTLKAE